MKRNSIDKNRSVSTCTVGCEERDKAHSLLLDSVCRNTSEMPILITHVCSSGILKSNQVDDFLKFLTNNNIHNRGQLLVCINSQPPSTWSTFSQTLGSSTKKQLEQTIKNEHQKPKTSYLFKSFVWFGTCVLVAAIASATYFYQKRL